MEEKNFQKIQVAKAKEVCKERLEFFENFLKRLSEILLFNKMFFRGVATKRRQSMPRKSKQGGPRNLFHGKGPFSTINKLTTRIRMIEAVKKYGLGGDALNDAIDRSEDPEFVESVINPHKLT